MADQGDRVTLLEEMVQKLSDSVSLRDMRTWTLVLVAAHEIDQFLDYITLRGIAVPALISLLVYGVLRLTWLFLVRIVHNLWRLTIHR